MPPPPPGIAPPTQWGDPAVIRERLGPSVRDIVFERDTMIAPALSLQHNRQLVERTAGPVIKLVEVLTVNDPQKLSLFREEFDRLTQQYYSDNTVRQGFLMTRATKV